MVRCGPTVVVLYKLHWGKLRASNNLKSNWKGYQVVWQYNLVKNLRDDKKPKSRKFMFVFCCQEADKHFYSKLQWNLNCWLGCHWNQKQMVDKSFELFLKLCIALYSNVHFNGQASILHHCPVFKCALQRPSKYTSPLCTETWTSPMPKKQAHDLLWSTKMTINGRAFRFSWK